MSIALAALDEILGASSCKEGNDEGRCESRTVCPSEMKMEGVGVWDSISLLHQGVCINIYDYQLISTQNFLFFWRWVEL